MACMHGTCDHHGDGRRNCRRDRVPKLTATGNRAAGCEFDSISEAHNTTSIFVDVRRPKDRMQALPQSKMPQCGQAAAFPRAGTSAG